MKDLLLGFLIGGIIGLWIGVNLGKDQPLMNNPFSDKTSMQEMSRRLDELKKDVSKKSKELYDDTKKAVDESF